MRYAKDGSQVTRYQSEPTADAKMAGEIGSFLARQWGQDHHRYRQTSATEKDLYSLWVAFHSPTRKSLQEKRRRRTAISQNVHRKVHHWMILLRFRLCE